MAGPSQGELDAAASDDANWLHPNRDYAGQRYAELTQIDVRSAPSLQPVCLYSSPELMPSQTNPIVYQGTMYITTAHYTIALDAADCGLRWQHHWEPKGHEHFLTQRGAALKDGRLVRGTPDGHLLALDAGTGEPLWSRLIADPEMGHFLSMPPLIHEDLVVIGPAGSEWAMKGWVGAFRLEDGEPVWKFNTIPDDGEPGADTWGPDPEARRVGGGSLWTPLALDAERGLVYVPVGNPAPDFYDDGRPGDNLYTNSLVALNVRTGELAWYYQTVPHDVHDFDLTQVSPVFQGRVGGRERTAIAVAGKEGLLRLVDADTHEVVHTVPFTTRENVDVPLTPEGVRVCPGILGGSEWNGPAYDPRMNTLYLPAVDWCSTIKKGLEAPAPEPFFMGGEFAFDPWEEARGWLVAIDAESARVRWRYESPKPMLAGVTATSGGVLFTGELTGDFLALDAGTGDVLYRFPVGSPLAGGVVTYTVDGRQYVAAVAGHVGAFNLFAPEIGGGTPTVVVFALPEEGS